MGNLFSSIDLTNQQDQLKDYNFFRRLSIEDIENLISHLYKAENITWADYFQIFQEFKEILDKKTSTSTRKQWNPVTSGYAMKIQTDTKEELNYINNNFQSVIRDDFTEDDISSDASNIETQNEQSTNINIPKPNYHSSNIHPVFFNYSNLKVSEIEKELELSKIEKKRKSLRAVTRAKEQRLALINNNEILLQTQDKLRIEKIENLQRIFGEGVKKRKFEFERNSQGLPDDLLQPLKETFEKEENSLYIAYDLELSELIEKSNEKSSIDKLNIQNQKDELLILKDFEQCEYPIAEKLEIFSKIEITRLTDNLKSKSSNLQKLYKQYKEMKEELSSNATNKSDSKFEQQVKSMLNIAETKLKNCIKEVNTSYEELQDAETLLKNALEMKNLENEILPLFRSFMSDENKNCYLVPSIKLTTAIILLSTGNYKIKSKYLMKYFGGCIRYDLEYFFKLIFNIYQILYALKIIRTDIPKESIENFVKRGFESFRFFIKDDLLSDFEALELFSQLIFYGNLSQYFGLTFQNNFFKSSYSLSDYQSHQMKGLPLLTKSLSNLSTSFVYLYREYISYKPCLNVANRKVLHDNALSMGNIDIFRSNYNRFLIKNTSKTSYYVQPLDNGQFMSIQYHFDEILRKAVLKIQSFSRSFLNRRLAERASKELAFYEAKQTAIKQLKLKILKEYQSRETSKGVGKMKWDAEVRMKQAKLRANGKSLNRNDTVMVMIEEALDQAMKIIDERFTILEKEEGIIKQQNNTTESSIQDDSTINSSFGISIYQIASFLNSSSLLNSKRNSMNLLDLSLKWSSISFGDNLNFNGQRPLLISESDFEKSFRLSFMASEVFNLKFLFNRLRLLNSFLTEFKTGEILTEFPSKRLLLKYFNSSDRSIIQNDLKNHFKIKRGIDSIIDFFDIISRGDLEYGIITRNVLKFQEYIEKALIEFYTEEQLKKVRSLQNYFQLKIQTSTSEVDEKSVLEQEKTNFSSLLASKYDIYRGTFKKFSNSQIELKNIGRSILLIEENIESLDNYEKNLFHKPINNIPHTSYRFNWSSRLKEALKLISSNNIKGFQELNILLEDFESISKIVSTIIVQELFLPDHEKSYQPRFIRNVDGRSGSITGKGINGSKPIYEVNNIYFQVCLDYDGIYNGSDEFASKAFGKEVSGSMFVIKQNIPKLNVPLVISIDYFGYRILAVSKIPIEHDTISKDFEIQQTLIEKLHGIDKLNKVFINKSRVASNLLNSLGKKLNLAEHFCKGINDYAISRTISASLKVYKGIDDEFYLRDCKSLFPHEIPDSTPHFHFVPRYQSLFWRFIRFELFQDQGDPISCDSGTISVFKMQDEEENYSKLFSLTNRLLTETIPCFLNELLEQSQTRNLMEDGSGEFLTKNMHKLGINIRHLGFMKSLLWRKLPGKLSLYHNEKSIKTSEDLTNEIFPGEYLLIEGMKFQIFETNSNKLTETSIPISKLYLGDSMNDLEGFCGTIDNKYSSDIVYNLILSEMISRSLKSIYRFELRKYHSLNKSCSSAFAKALFCEYLNYITGFNSRSEKFFSEEILLIIIEKFGPKSLRVSERNSLFRFTKHNAFYILKRVSSLLGFQLRLPSTQAFHSLSLGFYFCEDDIISHSTIIKTNIPCKDFLEPILISAKADDIAQLNYLSVIQKDTPKLFFTFTERKGSLFLRNLGSLGYEWNGIISEGCILEKNGPIKSEKFIRSIAFHPASQATIDIKYNDSIIPQSSNFTVELFFRCKGGNSLSRTILTSGRYYVGINRENNLTVGIFQNQHQIFYPLIPVQLNNWFHIILTFDGIYFRCYINSDLHLSLEIEPLFKEKIELFKVQYMKQLASLKDEEKEEKESLYETTSKEAEVFFQSKEGVSTLKKLSQSIFDLDANDDDTVNKPNARDIKERKNIATKKAKEKYIQDTYDNSIRMIGEKYKQLTLDLEDQIQKQINEGKLRSYQPLRIGGSLPDANSRVGNSFFFGEISCLSIFDSVLSSDQIRKHFISSLRNPQIDAKRLHSLAASKFKLAFKNLTFSFDNVSFFLDRYSHSLCYLFLFEPEERNIIDISKTLSEMKSLINILKSYKLLDVIAKIILHIPKDQEFSEIVVESILAIKDTDKKYFSNSLIVERSYLIWIPFEFGLISTARPQRFRDAAAFVFQEVVKDHNLIYSYGDVDLRWLPELTSANLINSIIQSCIEEKQMKIISANEIYSEDEPFLQDTDIQILSQNLPLLEGIDFSNCIQITDFGIENIRRLIGLKILILDGCRNITDEAIKQLKPIYPTLEVLSLEGLDQITSEAMLIIAQNSRLLTSLNINKCISISINSIVQLCSNNPNINSLGLSALCFNDSELIELVNVISSYNILNIDISFSSQLSEIGINYLGESLSNLRNLNLGFTNRITTHTLRLFCTKCWYLESLNIEDGFLLKDEIFEYNAIYDGRSSANELMLKNLKILIMKNCSSLSDKSIKFICERSRKLEYLNVSNCTQLTDNFLSFLSNQLLCPQSNVPACQSLVKLNLSYLSKISEKALLETLQNCLNLEEIDLSGLTSIVTDHFLKKLGRIRSNIQSLILNSCKLISDEGLCYISESLWLENIELEHCEKITNEGIQVIALSCTGLKRINLSYLLKVSNYSIDILTANCKNLEKIVRKL